MKTNYVWLSGLLVVAAVAAFLASYSRLPIQVPIHWNVHGAVDGYGSRFALLLLGPGLMAGEIVLFALLPRLSPRRFEMDSFLPTYWYLMLLVVVASGYFFALVLWSALTGVADISRAVLGGVAVLIALIGNVLGKVRRNFFVGVRTPWTLASERVWYATHRLAGKLMVLAGLAGLVLALLDTVVWLWLTVLLAGILTPVVYSLLYYKRLERRGELEGQ